MNVYDFDNTILKGDTEQYFFAYINDKKLLSNNDLLKLAKLYKKRIVNNKVNIFILNKYYRLVIRNIKNIDKVIEVFWIEHKKYIKPFYSKIRRSDDVVSSATPLFLLMPIFRMMKIKNYIAPEFNFKTYKFERNYNYGKNKAKNFVKKYGLNQIDKFYSDSDSDVYLAKIAKTPIKVIENKFEEWIIK